jgi:hypothetical protein
LRRLSQSSSTINLINFSGINNIIIFTTIIFNFITNTILNTFTNLNLIKLDIKQTNWIIGIKS